jgi:uncharacterized protein (TIGR00251 family)
LTIQTEPGAITFQVLVAPRASRERIGPVVGDRIKIAVTAPPVEGKANQALVDLLARALKVRRQDVEIVSGSKGKRKTVRVAGATEQDLLELLDG